MNRNTHRYLRIYAQFFYWRTVIQKKEQTLKDKIEYYEVIKKKKLYLDMKNLWYVTKWKKKKKRPSYKTGKITFVLLYHWIHFLPV